MPPSAQYLGDSILDRRQRECFYPHETFHWFKRLIWSCSTNGLDREETRNRKLILTVRVRSLSRCLREWNLNHNLYTITLYFCGFSTDMRHEDHSLCTPGTPVRMQSPYVPQEKYSVARVIKERTWCDSQDYEYLETLTSIANGEFKQTGFLRVISCGDYG